MEGRLYGLVQRLEESHLSEPRVFQDLINAEILS